MFLKLVNTSLSWGRINLRCIRLIPKLNSICRALITDQRWRLGIFGFLLAIAFCPCSGGAITLRWVVAAIGPWLIINSTPIKLSWRAIPLVVFVAYMIASAAWSSNGYDAVEGLIQLFVAGSAFVLGSSIRDPRPLYIGLAVGVPAAMLFNGFAPDYDLGGEAAAVAAIGVAAWGDWLLLPFPLMALVIGHSRGAWLGILAALLFGFRSWLVRGGVLLCSAGILAWKVFNESFLSLTERWRIWQDTWTGTSWLGNGLGSTWTSFPHYAKYQDVLQLGGVEHAHNDLLEVMFEQGFFGAALAIFAVGAVLCAKQFRTPEALVLIGILAIAMVGFPLHIPITLFVAAFACGRLCSGDSLRVDAWFSRISHVPKPPRPHTTGEHERSLRSAA